MRMIGHSVAGASIIGFGLFLSVPSVPHLPVAHAHPFESSQTACRRDCEITLTKVVTLSDSASPGVLPDYSFSLTRMADGGYATVSRMRDSIVFFDQNGKIKSVLDKPGGLSRMGNLLHGPGQKLLVYDYPTRNMATLSAGGTFERTIAMPESPSYVLADGRYIVAQQIRTPDLVGHPIHLVGTDGTVLRSFGADTPQHREDLRLVTTRVVAPGRDGTVWAAAPGRYVLERWDPTSGKRLEQVKVQQSWFVESSQIADRRSKPQPIIQGLWEEDGLVWTLIREADANWKPPATVAPTGVERPSNRLENDALFDWVFEAIDPASGAVLAHRRVPDVHWGRAPSPFIVSVGPQRDPKVPLQFGVWRLQLTRKEKEP